MDVVTHGLVGALAARAVVGRAPWPVVAAVAAGAVAPDLDVMARLWDPLAAITVHRTATHSLLGGLPLAVGVAAALRLAGARPALGRLVALAYLGVLSHIALDLVTPFGTAVLWPLDSRRVTLPWLYVIDAAVFGLAVGGLVATAGRCRPTRGPRLALAALAVYVLVAGAASRGAAAEFRRRVDAMGIPPERIVLTPVFPGPLRWLGSAETGEAHHQARFWLGDASAAPIETRVREVPAASVALERRPEVQAFRAFARVLALRSWVDGDDDVVEYRDLAFEDHPFGGPMVLRIRLDGAGVVQAIELGHRL